MKLAVNNTGNYLYALREKTAHANVCTSVQIPEFWQCDLSGWFSPAISVYHAQSMFYFFVFDPQSMDSLTGTI